MNNKISSMKNKRNENKTSKAKNYTTHKDDLEYGFQNSRKTKQEQRYQAWSE